MESGVHSSFHPNYHHQVVFAKFDLSILYSPPSERTVLFYEKVDAELIIRVINEFDLITVLSNGSEDKKICYFNKTLLNITHNFISHEWTNCGADIHLPNKAHGHDMLSVRMVKLCRNSICKPLSIIFNDCLKEGKLPSD